MSTPARTWDVFGPRNGSSCGDKADELARESSNRNVLQEYDTPPDHGMRRSASRASIPRRSLRPDQALQKRKRLLPIANNLTALYGFHGKKAFGRPAFSDSIAKPNPGLAEQRHPPFGRSLLGRFGLAVLFYPKWGHHKKDVEICRDAGYQIFISIDNVNNYHQETQEIINGNVVIELSPSGNELYGQKW